MDVSVSDHLEPEVELVVSGRFVLDTSWNPPPPKSIRQSADGLRFVAVGRGIELRLGRHANPLDDLLDARIVTSRGFAGLGSVEGGCAVLCNSNTCREWARRAGRPRLVAKVISVMADETRFVLLTQPKLKHAPRQRHESRASRTDAGLAPLVLVEPGSVECAMCPSHNVGEVYLFGG